MSFDAFLKEIAPILGIQWRPFQRRGIRRKVEQRIAELGLSRFDEYVLRVQKDLEEQGYLSRLLTVTISRFFRDRDVFETLEKSIFPAILQSHPEGELQIWSIGCASGEEPYSLLLLWKEAFEVDHPEIRLSLLGTDINEKMLQRAEEGRYKKSSMREMPPEMIENYFRQMDEFFVLQPSIKRGVEFKKHNVLREEPFSGRDLILCRNLAFTYFSKEAQREVLKKIASSLNEKGFLVIGRDERLPLIYPTLFVPIFEEQKIYQKFTPDASR